MTVTKEGAALYLVTIASGPDDHGTYRVEWVDSKGRLRATQAGSMTDCLDSLRFHVGIDEGVGSDQQLATFHRVVSQIMRLREAQYIAKERL